MIQARDRTFATQATSPFTDLFTTQLDGNCTGHDYPDLWFPHSEKHAGAAIEICQVCPARRECAELALEGRDIGVWAGVYVGDRHQSKATRRALRAVMKGHQP